jgi:hypothetical protein
MLDGKIPEQNHVLPQNQLLSKRCPLWQEQRGRGLHCIAAGASYWR